MRRLLIFGNGLGKAIDLNHFELKNAMQAVWDDPAILSQSQKDLINACIPKEENSQYTAPSSEDELDLLHSITFNCTLIQNVSRKLKHSSGWLTEEGKKFPNAVSRYMHEVATHLYLYPGTLPKNFTEPLIKFIRITKSHVATLNYDKLLYDALSTGDLLQPYYSETTLVDGFNKYGFNPSNLERRNGNSFGYYLHLHGSPLFHDTENFTQKINRNELTKNGATHSNHIVLSHVKHKPTIIKSSSILYEYWKKLRECIDESKEIFLVGYSGCDYHLNNLISKAPNETPIRIIEWGDPEAKNRIHYWSSLLPGKNITVNPYPNILEFDKWDMQVTHKI